MILKVYCVRDEKVEAFLPPILCRTQGEAERMFSTAVLSSEHQFSKSKADFTLYHCGLFDDVSGQFESGSAPIRVMGGLECVQD